MSDLVPRREDGEFLLPDFVVSPVVVLSLNFVIEEIQSLYQFGQRYGRPILRYYLLNVHNLCIPTNGGGFGSDYKERPNKGANQIGSH
jgi:hypothetical protein